MSRVVNWCSDSDLRVSLRAELIKDKNLLRDVELLKSQAERCKEILLRLSKNPHNLKDNFFEKIKILDIIKFNFDKFNTNKKLTISNLVKRDDLKTKLGLKSKSTIRNAIILNEVLGKPVSLRR